MAMTDGLLYGFLIALIGAVIVVLAAEVYILWRGYRADSTVIVLRERLIASICRLVGVVIWSGLLFRRVFVNTLPPEVIAIFTAAGVIILAIPAVRFVWIYRRNGFH